MFIAMVSGSARSTLATMKRKPAPPRCRSIARSAKTARCWKLATVVERLRTAWLIFQNLRRFRARMQDYYARTHKEMRAGSIPPLYPFGLGEECPQYTARPGNEVGL